MSTLRAGGALAEGHLPAPGGTVPLPPAGHLSVQSSGYVSRAVAYAAKLLPGRSNPASKEAATRS